MIGGALCQEALLAGSLRRGLLQHSSSCLVRRPRHLLALAPRGRPHVRPAVRAVATEDGQPSNKLAGALSVKGLQHPSLAWTVLAWSVYSVFIPLALRDQLVPAPIRDLAYGIAGNQQNVYHIFIGAVGIHTVEAAVAFYVARYKKALGLGQSLWWTLLGFVYGYIGLSLLFRQPDSTKVD